MAGENENILEQLNTARQQVTALTSERDGIRGQVAQLTTERDGLRTQLSTVTSERDMARGQIAQLATDRDSLQTRLNEANSRITALTASQADFNARLASELAAKGVRSEALPGERQPEQKTGMSLTERCLAVTGGKDQLEGKRN